MIYYLLFIPLSRQAPYDLFGIDNRAEDVFDTNGVVAPINQRPTACGTRSITAAREVNLAEHVDEVRQINEQPLDRATITINISVDKH